MRRTLVAVAASSLAAGAIALAQPAQAIPPVTPADMVAAVTQAQQATTLALRTIGGKSVCLTPGPDSHTLTVVSRASGVSFRHEFAGQSLMYAATAKKVWAPVDAVQYVDATTRQPVLAAAHAPAGTTYVKGPIGATAVRYLPDFQYADLDSWRTNLLTMFALGLGVPDWVSGPGVAVVALPKSGGAVQWRAYRTIDPAHASLATYDIDASGRQTAMQFTDYVNGVASPGTSCAISDYGSPGSLGFPAKSTTAPLAAVGIAAWRLHWTTTLIKQAADVVAAVVGAKKFTAVAIRKQAQVTILAAQLQNDVMVDAVSQGARMRVQDAQGHVVARCITVNGGIVGSAAC